MHTLDDLHCAFFTDMKAYSADVAALYNTPEN